MGKTTRSSDRERTDFHYENFLRRSRYTIGISGAGGCLLCDYSSEYQYREM